MCNVLAPAPKRNVQTHLKTLINEKVRVDHASRNNSQLQRTIKLEKPSGAPAESRGPNYYSNDKEYLVRSFYRKNKGKEMTFLREARRKPSKPLVFLVPSTPTRHATIGEQLIFVFYDMHYKKLYYCNSKK